jgi:hypothetical protein
LPVLFRIERRHQSFGPCLSETQPSSILNHAANDFDRLAFAQSISRQNRVASFPSLQNNRAEMYDPSKFICGHGSDCLWTDFDRSI